MSSRSESVIPSRFQRKLPPGRHDQLFKAVFGTTGAAARYLGVSRMQIGRYRRDAHLPDWVADVLTDLVQKTIEQAHQAQDDLRRYRSEPPKPPRRLSGCCAGYDRKPKRTPRTAAEWGALGY
jgi:hypothetical protein